MNEKQKDNWISMNEIKEKYNALSVDANLMLNTKKILNENIYGILTYVFSLRNCYAASTIS